MRHVEVRCWSPGVWKMFCKSPRLYSLVSSLMVSDITVVARVPKRPTWNKLINSYQLARRPK